MPDNTEDEVERLKKLLYKVYLLTCYHGGINSTCALIDEECPGLIPESGEQVYDDACKVFDEIRQKALAKETARWLKENDG